MSMHVRCAIVILAVAALLATAGCARQPVSTGNSKATTPTATTEPTLAPEPTPTPEPTTAPKAAPEPGRQPTPEPERPQTTESVRLYFTRDEKIGVAGRDVVVTAAGTSAAAEAAIRALLKGPSTSDRDYGLRSEIPKGTKLRGLTIKRKVATVDLSKRFAAGGGSLSMQMRAAQVVCTLTQFSGVRSVAFKLDGERIESLGGEGVTVGPSVDRDDFEDMLPAILVESPVPGQRVTSPLRLSGSANVFEAQFNSQVSSAKGKVLAEKSVKATSGSGTRGAFSTKLRFDVTGSTKGTVSVFDISEKDGSVVDRVDIPVRLRP